jgi:hypothetical protein
MFMRAWSILPAVALVFSVRHGMQSGRSKISAVTRLESFDIAAAADHTTRISTSRNRYVLGRYKARTILPIAPHSGQMPSWMRNSTWPMKRPINSSTSSRLSPLRLARQTVQAPWGIEARSFGIVSGMATGGNDITPALATTTCRGKDGFLSDDG